jgi:hypothetical protein
MPRYVHSPEIMALLLSVCLLSGPGIPGTARGAEDHSFYCPLALLGTEIPPLAEASFQKDKSGEEIHFTLKVHNLADITMAHLHLGLKEGMSTPVVWLYPSSPPPKLIPGPFEGVLAQGTITAGDLVGPLRGQPLAALITEMEAGNTYVNIHTKEHPGGDICGQVELSVQ